ncbi:PstS family phosphate ABC transporter substrate-binding protein [Microbacterium lacus]|uniref:PstS family phosphate ABC transporter substrate-binding protein n=1 Tax=Microbacterium lacus TaxID=415217 RepID=UPI003851527D
MSTKLAKASAAASVLATSLLLSSCVGVSTPLVGSVGSLNGTVITDGSSTVAPLTDAAADLFAAVEPDVDVIVTITGTSAGFRAFCDGETDVSNASRPISEEEIAACADEGVEFTEIVVANDGLSVIINPDNDWATDLTTEQLATIWAPESEGEVMSWNQVDPAFPDEPLVLFGAGSDSGTLDYFTEAINGEEGAIRADYRSSEDDTFTLDGVAKELGGVGFLGLSYVETNPDVVVAASIDGVAPSTETVQDGTYAPLSRPLFIYVSHSSYADKPEVTAFVDFYVEKAVAVADRALVVPLTNEQVRISLEELASLK